MTDNIIVALISSIATLLVVFLKLTLDKKKDKKIKKETSILLEDLIAKKATIILKEDGSEFDFTSDSSISDFQDKMLKKQNPLKF